MTRVAEIEQLVRELSPKKLTEFREWFAEYDAEVWDRQFETDAESGKLDTLAERALQVHSANRSKKG